MAKIQGPKARVNTLRIHLQLFLSLLFTAAVLPPYGRAAAADWHNKRTEVFSKQDRLRTNMPAENRSGIDQVQGVWVASDVKEQRLEGGVRVFKLTSQHVVVVMPLPARRHVRPQQQLDRDCDTGWEPFLAYSDDKIPTFACSPTTSRAKEALSELNHDQAIHNAMKHAFNVSAPCTDREAQRGRLWEMITGKSNSRQWLTALNDAMVKDVWHSDGCEFDPRPAGAEMITVLSYPQPSGSHEWQDEWGGKLEISNEICTDKRTTEWNPRVVLRITPSPQVLVMFSGSLVHRATQPSGRAPLSKGPEPLRNHEYNPASGPARWRFCQVMQIACYNARYLGPYEHYVFGMFPVKVFGAQYFEAAFYLLIVLLVLAVTHTRSLGHSQRRNKLIKAW